MSAKICGMYSYKGGAGRTVCMANVASILAKELGKRVVCIDMDMEGAGLGVVMGVHKRLDENGRKCIQDIFGDERIKSPEDFESNWWPHIHFDMGEVLNQPDLREKLYVVPAAFAVRTVEYTEHLDRTLRQFLRNIKNLVKPDIILLDSASGLQDWACLTMDCIDRIVVFFRWNKQFIEGTIKIINFMLESEVAPDDILMVPSAVPEVSDDTPRYQNILEASTNRLNLETNVEKNECLTLMSGVCEAVGLKWEERILNIVEDREPDEERALENLRMLASRIAQ